MASNCARRLFTCLVLACLVSACTDPRTDPEDPPGAAPAPKWTAIKIERQALPDQPTLTVTAAVDATDDVPLTLVGTVAEPGQPPRPVVWHPDEEGAGEHTALPVAAAYGWPTDISQVGSSTYVAGWAVEDGDVRSFVLSSEDRRAWKEVAIPAAAQAQGFTIVSVVDNGTSRPLAIGKVGMSKALAVDLGTGIVSPLPSGPGITIDDVTGAASLSESLFVLVEAHRSDGRDVTVVVRSTDGGRTWVTASELPGRNPAVTGIVATHRGLVATGSHTVGSTQRATAWSTGDGTRWHREPVRGGLDGWDLSLSAPVANGSTVYAAVADSSQTTSRILRRTSNGEWVDHGPSADDWLHPGTTPVLALAGGTVVIARSENGRFQVGRHERKGKTWRFRTSNADPALAPASTLEAMWFDAGGPVVVGSREIVEVTDGLGLTWDRRHRLAPFRVSRNRLGPGPWNPVGAEHLENIVTVGTADGRQVVVGESQVGDRTTLVGWTSIDGGRWTRVRGLRTRETAEARWLNLTGDGFALTGQVDGRPTVWTSPDGLKWSALPGRLGTKSDAPTIEETCALPDGSLLAVGHRQDSEGVMGPTAYRRQGGQWTRVGLSTLGPGVRFLSACTTTPSGTIVQGSVTADRLWVTTDGTRFEPLTIGVQDDHVARIIAVPDGFAAFGQRQDGNRREATVWLSTNGSDWSSVALPKDRFARPADAMLWGDRLVVTLTSTSGPGVHVLENLADLLSATRS